MFQYEDYDVIVAGAGPAGSTTAALVAEKGYRTLLLEREEFPRFKIGESLMPESNTTLKRLGLWDKLQASHFPKKYSVQFFAGNGKASAPFYFSEAVSANHPQTWQVLRSEFDQLLADNARDKGAEVHHGVSVREVLFEDERAVGLSVQLADGRKVRLGSRVVVDATGQNALISRRLKLMDEDRQLRNASIFTHFRGALRDEGLAEGATLVINTRDREAWFWYIPLPQDTVSVGVVAPWQTLIQASKRPPQEVFDEQVANCEGLKPRLVGATQLWPVKVLRDFTYRAKQRAGDGWVLVGDAYGFVDPLYSSGVLLALKSGEMAADAIGEALAQGDVSAARLGAFEERFLRGMEAVRKMVYAFYDPDFSFGKFLEKHPDRREDVVQILVGNVFRDDVDDLFGPMGEMTQLPEAWI